MTFSPRGMSGTLISTIVDSPAADAQTPAMKLASARSWFLAVSLIAAPLLQAQYFFPQTKTMEKLSTATLGGGCFWCVEAVFEQLPGVHNVVSGYAGGKTDNPTYREVCEGTTGHAEVCQIHFDAKVISYEKILEVFWLAHDPTTLNRQGNDVGTQYRSVIYYHDAVQQTAATKAKAAAGKDFRDPIVTEISPLPKFYEAEQYHQDYFLLNPNQGYCNAIIAPKLRKLLQDGVISDKK